MKTLFVLDGYVVSHGSSFVSNAQVVSTVAGAVPYQVDDACPADVGWRCSVEGGVPVFEPSPSVLPLLTPMTLYMAFKPAERIAIKASKDPMVEEFWAMYQLSAQLEKPTDPNLVSVQEAIAYLAAPASPGPGAGILASVERVQQILQGIPQ
jgi:hypothetical protein